MNFKKAFTLIELMVVITIISILASMTVVIIQQSQVKVHDKEVISNFNTIKKALISYYAEKKVYPEPKDVSVSGCPSGWEIGNIANSGNFLNALKDDGQFISLVPREKSGGNLACSYRYKKFVNASNLCGGCNGNFIVLYAQCNGGGCNSIDVPSCCVAGSLKDLVEGDENYSSDNALIYMSME